MCFALTSKEPAKTLEFVAKSKEEFNQWTGKNKTSKLKQTILQQTQTDMLSLLLRGTWENEETKKEFNELVELQLGIKTIELAGLVLPLSKPSLPTPPSNLNFAQP